MTEWKSADEWMPPDGKRVLVLANRGDKPLIEISTFNLVESRWDGFDVDEITHWAEMPGFPPLAVIEQASPLPLPQKRQQELFDHLVKELEADYAAFCVCSLAFDMEAYSITDQNTAPTVADYRKVMDASHDARRLYRLCCDYQHLEKYAAYCWALSNDLMIDAKDASQTIPKKRGRGRPPANRCREELIKRIYGHYPKELKKKSANSHFEKTVEMILGWVEPSPPQDIHAAIIRALGCKNYFQ